MKELTEELAKLKEENIHLWRIIKLFIIEIKNGLKTQILKDFKNYVGKVSISAHSMK